MLPRTGDEIGGRDVVAITENRRGRLLWGGPPVFARTCRLAARVRVRPGFRQPRSALRTRRRILGGRKNAAAASVAARLMLLSASGLPVQ
jgi:hypothetical protein